jgi:hypothetical protein
MTMPPSPPPQGRSTRLAVAMGASLFAMLWLAGWSHAAPVRFAKTVSDAGLGQSRSGVHSRGFGGGPGAFTAKALVP